MVLGWKDGNNSVIDGLLEKVRRFEERVNLLEIQNSAQKQEISKLTNNLNNWKKKKYFRESNKHFERGRV